MNDVIPESNVQVQEYLKFDAMKLKEELLYGIFSVGFEEPSKIQKMAIVPIISGRDSIIQAQSGTGKTATFAIALLQRIDTTKNYPQVVVMSPTRELALQSYDVIKRIGSRMSLKIVPIIGGTEVNEDARLLNAGCQVVVGTPGRLLHMITRGDLKVDGCDMLVLDEADEMLSRGFSEQIAEILKTMNKEIQIVLVSATLPDEVLKMAQDFMRNPVEILVRENELTLDGIRQYKIELGEDNWKKDTLFDLYKVLSIQQSVIFCNSISRVRELAEAFTASEFTVSCIHSELDQSERNAIMAKFRAGESRILVATNIISRGIDVQNVSLVVNYDMPKNPETYLHRIGRSGRFGRKGVAINFILKKEEELVKSITDKFGITLEELPKDVSALF